MDYLKEIQAASLSSTRKTVAIRLAAVSTAEIRSAGEAVAIFAAVGVVLEVVVAEEASVRYDEDKFLKHAKIVHKC